MEIISLFFIFIAIEFFESNWQKSDTLFGLIKNNFSIFKKNIFLYFILHPSFFYTIFLSFYLNNFGFLMSSILILKFLDISFKLILMKNLLNGREIDELLQFNMQITPLFRYMNVIIYPITFIFATTL
ncbi:hypothetical protein CP964_14130 [Arcobacter defluvii]|jgi:hypothetical protein|uniref:Membrane protein n=2 Tax=Arcobacteraceae TaxID=2808963 RepID=A0AAE7E835_9BACT|nr:putative membrane protein [Arcobacter defluvii]RXI29157.1 hypothetical protein CP964_14130 [Arcobacter defluvii]